MFWSLDVEFAGIACYRVVGRLCYIFLGVGIKNKRLNVTKGSPLGDSLSLICEASVGEFGSNN